MKPLSKKSPLCCLATTAQSNAWPFRPTASGSRPRAEETRRFASGRCLSPASNEPRWFRNNLAMDPAPPPTKTTLTITCKGIHAKHYPWTSRAPTRLCTRLLQKEGHTPFRGAIGTTGPSFWSLTSWCIRCPVLRATRLSAYVRFFSLPIHSSSNALNSGLERRASKSLLSASLVRFSSDLK
jgi:hypothetical protein